MEEESICWWCLDLTLLVYVGFESRLATVVFLILVSMVGKPSSDSKQGILGAMAHAWYWKCQLQEKQPSVCNEQHT